MAIFCYYMTITNQNKHMIVHDSYEKAPAENEKPKPQVLDQSGLETIELQVRDRLMQGDTDEQMRELTSSLLESIGQAPLAEGEAQRSMKLLIDGQEVEHTIVVDPSDFGTFVRTPSEMGLEGFESEASAADTESAHDEERSHDEIVDRELGELALEHVSEQVEVHNLEVSAPEAKEPTEAAVDIDEINEDDEEAETEDTHESDVASTIDELIDDPSWKRIGDTAGQLMSRTKLIVDQLDAFSSMLGRLNYEGGRTETSGRELAQSLDDMKRSVMSGSLHEDLRADTMRLYQQAEETVDQVRRNEASNDTERLKARKTEEVVDELTSAGRVLADEYDELRTVFRPNGKFESLVEELIRSPNGYEYTISMLRKMLMEASEDMTGAVGRLSRMESNLEDARRIPTIQ